MSEEKNGAASAAKKAHGRSVLRYLLPTLLLSVVVLAVVVLVAQQRAAGQAAAAAVQSAERSAAAIAAAVVTAIKSRGDLLTVALADGEALRALEAKDRDLISAVEGRMQRQLPGLIRARLMAKDASQPDPSAPAPLGYAGLDMVRRTVTDNRPAAAEIHQIETGAPYLALSLPVTADTGPAVGAVFAAWDMRFLGQLLEQAGAGEGFQLRQGDGVVIAGEAGSVGALDGAVDVAGSIWTVHFATVGPSLSLSDWMVPLAVLAGGFVLLVLITLWQARALSADLRVDMAALVNLGEAILRRSGNVPGTTRLTGTADALALLGQYAHEAARGQGRRVQGVARPAAAPAAASAPAFQQVAAGLDLDELEGADPAEFLGGAAAQQVSADIPDNVFRAYDIRGVVGSALTPAFAEVLGSAVGTLVQENGGRKVAVGYDARLSSRELCDALTRGLNASGCDVMEIGMVPTPLLYYALQKQPVQGGVMVTGSHNPPDHNGFKIVIGDRVLDGAELTALKQRMREGAFSQGNGTLESLDISADYVSEVTAEVQLPRPLKVVIDAGNGAAGALALAVFEALGCEVVPLFCEADGHFPNHHPDPGQPANMTALMLEVQAQGADLGIAFDGDGDRIGLVDENGGLVFPDMLLMLLAADVLSRHPGVDVIYDVKSSRNLAGFVLGHGGRPIMWQSGHSRMRAKMVDSGALLGGEFTGHLFIKERWYGFDDAIYAGARTLELLALEGRPFSELLADLPQSVATPEYLLPVAEGRGFELMGTLDARQAFSDARMIEIDGLRIEFAEGWGLIRPSNTAPALTFRFEAESEDALEQIKTRFRDMLQRAAPDLHAPF